MGEWTRHEPFVSQVKIGSGGHGQTDRIHHAERILVRVHEETGPFRSPETIVQSTVIFNLLDRYISIQYLDTRFGPLILGSFGERLCLCDWKNRKTRTAVDRRIQQGLKATYMEEESDVTRKAADQLNEYLNLVRTKFDLTLLPVGTSFQKKVWEELIRIPFGKTETYLGLARKIRDDKMIRAVAAASGANALSIFVPCHRLVGSHGELTGYAGGKEVKRKLLLLEKSSRFPGQFQLFT